MRQIPSQFRVANRLWRVEYVEAIDDEGSVGETDTRLGVIRIIEAAPHEYKRHTFMHELVHVLAYAMGWEKLDENETRVEALAGLLEQAFDTAVYPIPPNEVIG